MLFKCSGKKYIPIAITLAVQFSPMISSSFACGFCREDQGAAVYSYKNKKAAHHTGNKYVVVELLGLNKKEQVPEVVHVLKSIAGVCSETVRLSYEQRSASFVYDRKLSLHHIIDEVKRRLSAIQIRQT